MHDREPLLERLARARAARRRCSDGHPRGKRRPIVVVVRFAVVVIVCVGHRRIRVSVGVRRRRFGPRTRGHGQRGGRGAQGLLRLPAYGGRARELRLERVRGLRVPVVHEVAQHEPPGLLAPLVVLRRRAARTLLPLLERRGGDRRGGGGAPGLERAPVDARLLDARPDRVALLLHVVVDVVFKGLVPEVNADGLVRVAKSDRGVDLDVFRDVLEYHA